MMLKLRSSQKIGLGILLFLFIASVLVSLLSPYSIAEQNLNATFLPPDADYWLGTDQFGRSMAARMASAILLSFGLGILCVLTSAIVGISLGVWAAWSDNYVDSVLNVIVNILLALPGLVLVLLFAAIAPGSFWVIYLAISMIQWVEYFRVVRAITRTVIRSPERQSSAMMGFGIWYQFKRHIWPALTQPVFTLASFGGANAIMMMASLGFVYVGIQPPLAELGLMSVELFPYYNQAPWVLAQPLAAIALLILGFHLLAGKKHDADVTTD